MTKLSRFASLMLAFAGVAGAAAIALAAFAAHVLPRVSATPDRAVKLFNEATAFQLSHALALLIATLLAEWVGAGRAQRTLRVAALLLAAAILLFPTALYASAFGHSPWWAPYGGFAAIIAWLLMAVGAVLATWAHSRNVMPSQ